MGHQMRVGSSTIAILASCGRYMISEFIYETKIIMCEYIVPQYGFSLTSKQMTLNDPE